MAQTHTANVNRIKRDLGITATMIAAIVFSIRGAVAGTVWIMQTSTTADTLNQIVIQSAKALYAQEVINQHPYQATRILQQQIDLLAEVN